MTHDNSKIYERLTNLEIEQAKLIEQCNHAHGIQDLLEKRIDKFEGNNELLFKMSVILEQTVEANKKQTVQIEKMDGTFNKINENLIILNASHNELKSDFKEMKEKVDDIEEDIDKQREDDSISVTGQIKKYMVWILGLPTVIIGAWLMKYFGL